jgi:hypothetical protein
MSSGSDPAPKRLLTSVVAGRLGSDPTVEPGSTREAHGSSVPEALSASLSDLRRG